MSRIEINEEDVKSLCEVNPLMEGVINYVFVKAAAIAQRPDVVYFLDPAVAHTMYAFEDASLGPVDEICRVLIVVIPIAEYKAVGFNGVHWSVLLLQRMSVNVPFDAFRLDSLSDKNEDRCLSFLHLLYSCSTCTDHMPRSSTIMKFPSQRNDVDCGCFVCMAALHVAEAVKNWNDGATGLFDGPLEFPHELDASLFRRSLLGEVLREGR
ncbi:hypothetical protein ECC02_002677 [Trypanosoma cruzi]|uniref:Ubiquitin-like protease family profile domain-containing protein n=1 Tax=Trypanosoma cruzi TaxID=5693 RepID=A0A7J6YBH5_TRYCR|nr:hypothetical protein ECC02_002677 [Trypanosoma cruzi]